MEDYFGNNNVDAKINKKSDGTIMYTFNIYEHPVWWAPIDNIHVLLGIHYSEFKFNYNNNNS